MVGKLRLCRLAVCTKAAASSGIVLVFNTTNDSRVMGQQMATLAREAIGLLSANSVNSNSRQ